MKELLKAIRLLGLPTLLRVRRGYDIGWQETIRGYVATRLLQVMINIGFIDALQEQQSVDVHNFAAAHKLDASMLNSLCEALYAMEIFQKKGNTYALGEKGRLLIDTFRGWIEVSYGYSEIFHRLESLLAGEQIYANDFYRRSDYVARGSGEMNQTVIFPLVIDMIEEKGYSNVLDLGCGDGTFLRHLCRLKQDVTGYGIDLAPDAIENGKRLACEDGLRDRIHLYAEDVCKLQKIPEPMNGVDVATIFFVLHEILYIGEDMVIEFLRSFKSLFPGTPLIVFEAIRPSAEEMRKKGGLGIYYYLYHDLSHQKPVSRQRWHELFQKAGCRAEERFLPYAGTAIFTIQ